MKRAILLMAFFGIAIGNLYAESFRSVSPRNRLINGAMRIDQRNEGTSASITTNSPFTYGPDRWTGAVPSSQARFGITKLSSGTPDGFTNYMEVKVTSATVSTAVNHSFYILYQIEGSDLYDLGWGSTATAKPATLSFWVKSSSAGIYGGSIRNAAGDRSFAFSYTIASAGSWSQKVISIPGDKTGSWLKGETQVGAAIFFDLGSGSSFQATPSTWSAGNFITSTNRTTRLVTVLNSSWNITGVQFEKGSSPSEFEYVPDYVELERCQRYYYKTFQPGTKPVQNSGSGKTALSYRAQITGTSVGWNACRNYPVVMIGNGTITTYSPSDSSANWYNESDSTQSGVPSSQSDGRKGICFLNPQVAGDEAGDIIDIHFVTDADFQ